MQMYNRYVSGGFEDLFAPVEDPPQEQHDSFVDVEETEEAKEEPPRREGLFGGIKLPEMNAETILLLVIVYFLIAEEGESIGDTLLIIGILLILGF